MTGLLHKYAYPSPPHSSHRELEHHVFSHHHLTVARRSAYILIPSDTRVIDAILAAEDPDFVILSTLWTYPS